MSITFSLQGIKGYLISIPLGILFLTNGICDVSQVLARPIQSDQSLKKASQVKRLRNQNQFKITGGTQQGKNLFHSFSRFSVPQGHNASFQGINPRTTNVLIRVSGNIPSHIHGGIELLTPRGMSRANFVLLNPNGLRFHPGASIQGIRGSFIATTGESLGFSNGMRFSTNNLANSSVSGGDLLTIRTGENPGEIRLNGVSSLLNPSPGHALIFIGGPLKFVNSRFRPTDIRMELASLASQQSLKIKTQGIPRLDIQQAKLDDISLKSASQITLESISDQPQTGIFVTGKNILLQDESAFISFAPASVPIKIQAAKQLQVKDTSFIFSDNFRTRKAGSPINIKASQLLLDCGGVGRSCAIILTRTSGAGAAGAISIDTQSLDLLNGGQIASLAVDENGRQPGNIKVNSNHILIQGGFILNQDWRASGIVQENRNSSNPSTTDTPIIQVAAQELTLLEGGVISSATSNTSAAGILDIRANQIDISGNALNPDGTLVPGTQSLPNLPISSGLFSSVNSPASGRGGSINIQGQQLTIREGGKVQTASFGSGQAGEINIQSEIVNIAGQDQDGLFPSVIFAGSGGIPGLIVGNSEATGAGNDISINSDVIVIQDGGAIAVGSLNTERQNVDISGDINLNATQILLRNQGQLIGNTASGNGGNISISGKTGEANLVLLLDSSQISTTAGLNNKVGDGGNITLKVDQLIANQDIRPNTPGNDITSRTSSGRGGNITIDGSLLLGLKTGIANPGNQLNDIDVSAQADLGTPGTINIAANLVNPGQKLSVLPQNIRIPKVSQACDRSSTQTQNSLINSGKGGLSQAPKSYAKQYRTWEDLRPKFKSQNQKLITYQRRPNSNIQEATSFQQTASGQWMLANRNAVVLSQTRCSS